MFVAMGSTNSPNQISWRVGSKLVEDKTTILNKNLVDTTAELIGVINMVFVYMPSKIEKETVNPQFKFWKN